MSSQILNEQITGFERVERELVAAGINPIRGVNRVIYGDAWKQGPRYVDCEAQVPYKLEVKAGYKWLEYNRKYNNNGESMGVVDIILHYNDHFNIDGGKPFDYFKAGFTFNFSPTKPTIGTVNFFASIWCKNFDKNK